LRAGVVRVIDNVRSIDPSQAAAFGPYYYVFVILCLVLMTPVFARLPSRVIVSLTFLFLGLDIFATVNKGFAELGSANVFQTHLWLRSPHRWWGYFLLGWMLREHHGWLSSFVVKHRSWVSGGLMLAVAAVASALVHGVPPVATDLLMWANILLVLMLLFSLASGRTLPSLFVTLSEYTYPIYLFHLFFVLLAQDRIRYAYRAFAWSSLLIPWAAGLVGSLILILVMRRILGRRSRTWIGA